MTIVSFRDRSAAQAGGYVLAASAILVLGYAGLVIARAARSADAAASG